MNDENFIDGVYSYCDSWCERCEFKRRCRVRAMEMETTARFDQSDAEKRDAGKSTEPAPPTTSSPKRRRISGKPTGHELIDAAGQYMDRVYWFLTKREHRKVPSAIREPHEVVAWYFMFISAKLRRASGNGKRTAMNKKIARDSDANGSAKVALIGVENSIAAWSHIRDARPKLAPYASRRIADLARIRVLIEKHFPDCRLFIRPGFDTHEAT